MGDSFCPAILGFVPAAVIWPVRYMITSSRMCAVRTLSIRRSPNVVPSASRTFNACNFRFDLSCLTSASPSCSRRFNQTWAHCRNVSGPWTPPPALAWALRRSSAFSRRARALARPSGESGILRAMHFHFLLPLGPLFFTAAYSHPSLA
ncbi:MAG: hypothetical protein HY906_21700 [Deltaproteobacteria bacterium]|nr:hypothetical protein [Deltaproteobacteria bacterium]